MNDFYVVAIVQEQIDESKVRTLAETARDRDEPRSEWPGANMTND